MAKVRFKETTMDSFFGNFLYQQKVDKEHFLRKLDEVIDWRRFTRKLLKYYKGKGEAGQAPYNPTLILKMLLLSYLYNVSERQIETLANDSLSIGFFPWLGADAKAPDHSTLTLFKNRLISQFWRLEQSQRIYEAHIASGLSLEAQGSYILCHN